MITELPLGLGAYQHRVKPFASLTCVNMYAEVAESPSLSSSLHLPTPGITQVATSGQTSTQSNRGVGRLSEKPYFVNGQTLYRLESDLTLTELGTIPGSGRVVMADNPTQLLIVVPGLDGYVYTEADGLNVIADIDYKEANGIPTGMVFIDGYFVCVTDSNKIIVSNLNDGTAWSALDFSSAESSPDGLVTPFVLQNQLYIGGTQTIEQYTNVGGADFPFQRTNSFQDKGVSSRFSVISTSRAVIFLGAGPNERPCVYALIDGEVEKVSTHPVDQALSDLTAAEVADVYSWQYMEDGHLFVGFQLPEQTFVFDLTTRIWHTRKSRTAVGVGGLSDGPCRISSIVSAYGEIYVADLYDGRIGLLSQASGSEYGEPMLREVASQPFHNDRKQFQIPFLELAVESGGGFTVEMSYSRDGGRTWSDPKARDLPESVYERRAVWRRIGLFKESVSFRFQSASTSDVAFLALYADIILDPEREAELRKRRTDA